MTLAPDEFIRRFLIHGAAVGYALPALLGTLLAASGAGSCSL